MIWATLPHRLIVFSQTPTRLLCLDPCSRITMPQFNLLLITTAVASVFAAALYQLGLFDWPAFEESTLEPQLHVLLASTTSKDIAGSVERLLVGTREAIESVAKERLAPAAAAYGAPEGATALSVGLYFDDPGTVEHPRWGLGWAIQVEENDPKLLANIHAEVAKASTLDEPIRLVTLGGGSKILTARIPWRTMITPAVAPMLHWGRAFKVYKSGGYQSNSGREGDEGSIACELYVTGPKDSMEYIDYSILMGDTTKIFNGMYPLETNPQEETEDVMEEPKEAEPEQESDEVDSPEEATATE